MKRAIGAAVLLASVSVVALSPQAFAAATNDKLQALQDQIDALNAQVGDLKRSTSDQYADVQAQRGQDVQISLKNGRPTFKTADGDFSLAIRSLVQFDSAYYAPGKAPTGIDFSSGANFRRARLGVNGTLFKDWSYEFIYDFGGSATEASTISSAFIQYDGLAPVHFKLGAYAPPESFEDSTSASDLIFLERAQPTDLARGIAGADGRDAATIFSYDDNYFAAISYTGGVVADAAAFDEQQAVVGRFAYRFINTADANLAVGADATDVFKFADTAAGPGSPHALRLRERPELNVDSENLRLIDTSTIDADSVVEWGAEAAGNWESLYAQGGYFNFDVSRRTGVLPDPSFSGWYAQASWILTGEAKPYRPERGAFSIPTPARSGLGAWELAARYSVLDLDFDEGSPGFTAPLGVRGGEQRIWTLAINWYPNSALRFVLDFQHTEVSRLNAGGGDIGADLNAVSLRAQLSL